ncbi:MAG: hypothetical protein WD595_06580 [Waddliaceae bacterium]
MSFSEVKEAECAVDAELIENFYAKTPINDQFFRLANYGIWGAAFYGAYGCVTGPIGIASCVALAPAARKVISTALGYFSYPASWTSFPGSSGKHLKNIGEFYLSSLRDEGYTIKKVSLLKSGTRYDAVLIGHKTTIQNGKWTIHALGGRDAIETSFIPISKRDYQNGCNTMLINGPSVCGSGGCPTRYQMGAGFEAGLQFLETCFKATHIAMHGFSLGGGMMSEAILQHQFAEDIQYLFIADRTFKTLSDFASVTIGKFAKPIFLAAGMELDCIAASKKLEGLKITQIVLQHKSEDAKGTDGMIPDIASFAKSIDRNESKTIFFESEEVSFDKEIPIIKKREFEEEVRRFFCLEKRDWHFYQYMKMSEKNDNA